MGREVLLSLDQGTTNTKAVLVSRDGELLHSAAVPVALEVTAEAHIQQSAEELWNSVLRAAQQCVSHAAQSRLNIAGIAISNQRETALAWRRGACGEALSPAISWQCRRSLPVCEHLHDHAQTITDITGLQLDPLLSATKWAWLMKNVPGIAELADTGSLCLGTVDSWLLHNLTGGEHHATDHTNASRTGLLDLHEGCWSQRAIELFELPAPALAQVWPCTGPFGSCRGIPGLDGIPILAVAGDSHAAMASYGSVTLGTAKVTYGTGSSFMQLCPPDTSNTAALARTIAWSEPGTIRYALEGNITMTGAALQWLAGVLQIPSVAELLRLASTVPDAAGVIFIPAMAGLGAPHWQPAARGAFFGLAPFHTSAHLARSGVNAIAHQVADVVEASPLPVSQVYVDGGLTRHADLLQLQADVLGCPVLLPAAAEASALGAAMLAGISAGWWQSIASAPAARTGRQLQPCWTSLQRSQARNQWKSALSHILPASGSEPLHAR